MVETPGLVGVVPIDRSNVTLADRVEQALRLQIVQGQRATGSRLNEGEIAASFGVSRGPVREAVQRLAHRGLVTLESHRGAFVRTLDLHEVRELFEVRVALECEAAELAATRIDAAGVAELSALQEQLAEAVHHTPQAQRPAIFDDVDLHELVVRHAANDRLATLVNQVNSELRLARSRSTSRSRADEAITEHHELVACLTAGDAAGAREAMRVHLRAALANTIHLLESQE